MSRFWLFLLLTFSAASAAQPQTHVDAATELVEALHSEEDLQQAFDMIFPQFLELQTQMGVPENRQKQSEQVMEEVATAIKEVMTWERMRAELVVVYADVFTEQELRELVDFYRSPIGKKYVEKQPEMAQATMKISGEMMRELMPRIREISNKVRVEKTESQASSDR